MANHGTQLRLAREFSESYPDITYETRPDTLSTGTGLVIKNDAAAQLFVCDFQCSAFSRSQEDHSVPI